jgi:glycosyl transferase family 2
VGDPLSAGVSFVIPVYNGERTLGATLASVFAEAHARPFEVIVVDDGSSDASQRILDRYVQSEALLLLRGEGRGAAAALNLAILRARHEVVAQVDQDVALDPGWLDRLAAELGSAPDVAAAQAHYRVSRADGLWARVMGLDLELRAARLERCVDHVCTGNTLYRKSALVAVGLFDESLGYGYDNCMSYRLGRAGYRLVQCPEATGLHRWRADLRGYLLQQFGVATGRLDLIEKYPDRVAGDQVSGLGMILHAAATALALASLVVGVLCLALGAGAAVPLGLAVLILALLALERGFAGLRAAAHSGDPAGLLFPVAHALRDAAWVAAIIVWLARRAFGRARMPGHSMLRVRE